MGIKDTFTKLTGQSTDTDTGSTSPRTSTRRSAEQDKEYVNNTNASHRRSGSTTSQHKLPPGTGPGTSGKPASESAMEYDRDRAREQGTIAGYGTDSAAAHGGGIADTHRDSLRRSTGDRRTVVEHDTTVVTSSVGQAAPVVGASGREHERIVSRDMPSGLGGTILEEIHQRGHTKHDARDAMPSGATQEDTNQLNPITHERIRHLETEEVQRVKEVDRHIHHIQHHIQPVIASEILVEQLRDFIHPVTSVREIHANKAEDNALFGDQVRQYRDTLTHLEKERTVIDKGTTVRENVHHHVHHVIQPIIEKETVDRQRIRTTIPIHEVTHEAPIVHQSQTHKSVPLEHFLDRGGILQNAISADEIGSRVLHVGQCKREVEGVAEDLERELRIAERAPEVVTTTTTTRTTQTHLGDTGEMVGLGTTNVEQKPVRDVGPESDVPVTMPMA